MSAQKFLAAVMALAYLLSTTIPVGAQEWCVRRSRSDISPHRSEFISLHGVRLHYLDWGGAGPVLLFLHGLGNNAHTFDDLAPRGRALTRRGSGQSDQPSSRDDIDTLTADSSSSWIP